ncbi:MAG: M56 family metallopeptidase [Eubacteriales bacterium]|nr:M56 family metallopeptidase [Eubacteriales bacterium]
MRKLINVVITSSIMIVVVMILRKLFGSKVKSGVICVLWALVAIRLLIPVQLFGNVVNVTDYLTKNVMNLQSRDITTEVQEKSDSVSDPQIGDDSQAGGGARSDGNLQAGSGAQSDGNIQTGSSMMSDGNSQTGGYVRSASHVQSDDYVKIVDYMRIIWLTGMVVMFAVVVVSNLIFTGRLMSSRKLTGKRGRINIYNTDAVDSACLYGVVHPAVYVNDNVLNNEFIINHEMTHYRHRDNWWALVRMLCVCIYWFNPLVWVAAHFHKEDCELFCDEAVIRNCSASERQKYGEVLLNAATRHSGRLSDIYLLSGASAGYRELKKRIERIAGSRKTYKSAAFVLIMIVVAVTVLAFGGGSVKGSSELPESGIDADTQTDNAKMQNYLVMEYKYDLTHDGVDDAVSIEIYGNAVDINNVDEALKDTRKYVTVTAQDGVTGQILYTKEVGNSHSQNGFVSIVSENGNYYIMDGIKGVWQGDGLERFTVYDFSSGVKNVVDECKVDYYASEESAERAANRGQVLVSQQEADEMYNGRIARWNDGAVVLIECLN